MDSSHTSIAASLQRRHTALWAAVLAVLLFVSLVLPVQAADIARDVREGRSDQIGGSGGYLELSLAIEHDGVPVVDRDDNMLAATVSLGGHYRYQRFFLDVFSESYARLQAGFNLYSGPNWSIDLLSAISQQGVDSNFSDEIDIIDNRLPGFNAGVRATNYSGAYIGQVELLRDAINIHGGFSATGFIGRQWLLRNWNLHALVGARFESDRVLDYQFGVDEEDATERFGVYEADAGTTFVTELGITYPIREYLIFRGTFRWWNLPLSIVESPFITDETYQTASAALVFVY